MLRKSLIFFGFFVFSVSVWDARGMTGSLVPDKAFKNSVCSRIKTDGELDQDTRNELNSLCKDQSISSTDWMKRIELVKHSLLETDKCPSCVFSSVFDGEVVPEDFGKYIVFVNPERNYERYGDITYLEPMYLAFKNFGNAIGDRKAAIWFATHTGFYDSERSRKYCDALGLNYNDGPYIVLTKTRPDDWVTGTEFFYLKLNSIEPELAIKLLNKLEQGIRTENIVPGELIFNELVLRVQSILKLKDFGSIESAIDLIREAIK